MKKIDYIFISAILWIYDFLEFFKKEKAVNCSSEQDSKNIPAELCLLYFLSPEEKKKSAEELKKKISPKMAYEYYLDCKENEDTDAMGVLKEIMNESEKEFIDYIKADSFKNLTPRREMAQRAALILHPARIYDLYFDHYLTESAEGVRMLGDAFSLSDQTIYRSMNITMEQLGDTNRNYRRLENFTDGESIAVRKACEIIFKRNNFTPR